MKKIPLSNINDFTIVDDDDYEELSKHKWRVSPKGYVIRYCKERKMNISMHREIMKPEKGETVDHKNGDKLDNQRSTNLRNCLQKLNNYNKPSQHGTSQYKGVRKKGDKWQAQITYEGKNIHLGTSESEIACACAYNEKAKELFGEYARLNDVPDDFDWRPLMYNNKKSSKYKGVTYLKTSGRWRSYVYIDKKQKPIGVFATEDEAYQARIEYLNK